METCWRMWVISIPSPVRSVCLDKSPKLLPNYNFPPNLRPTHPTQRPVSKYEGILQENTTASGVRGRKKNDASHPSAHIYFMYLARS
eukprot:9079693-Prorocentrum_lima.AAC.1